MIFQNVKAAAGKRPSAGAAADVEKCALRPCRQPRECSSGSDTERSAANAPRERQSGGAPLWITPFTFLSGWVIMVGNDAKSEESL